MRDILVIDDDISAFEDALRHALRGYRLYVAGSGKEGLRLLEERPEIELVLLDIKMAPDFAEIEEREGVEVLKRIKHERPNLPVIMLTVLADIDLVIETIQEGAFYYITKPIDRDKLRGAVERALENVRLKHEVGAFTRARDALLKVHAGKTKAREAFQGMIGAHPLMQRLYDQIERVAQFPDINVLIMGETGSGKDLVASAIHQCSPRRDGPFVAVNCSALAETLLDAELFGHEKGVFTGADVKREGLFGRAHTGTLFLDEIGEMSAALQSKLLRAIESKEITPVGGSKPVNVDVRIVSATNRDLAVCKERGQFREDLYYRISHVPLTLPPLRDRKQDIPALVRHFLKEGAAARRMDCTIEPGAMKALMEYDWPGNVRELAFTIARLAVFVEEGRITETAVRETLNLGPASQPADEEVYAAQEPEAIETVAEAKETTEPAPSCEAAEESFPTITDLAEYCNIYGRRKLRDVLERAVRGGGNARGAMRLLGMSEERYDVFRKWLQRLGVSVRSLTDQIV